MIRYIIISLAGGILFGVMDGIINANPLAQKLYVVFKPIAKASVNVTAGIIIDLIYGFVLTGLFLLFYNSLPGTAGIVKGISYAVIVWFLRVLLQWLNISINDIVRANENGVFSVNDLHLQLPE